ncbi:MAG TPA: hypothetical protein VEL51_13755 [Vicinamibacterales bacterium]|nr:hypothetical protein [Vicinamibacterales bacterium]
MRAFFSFVVTSSVAGFVIVAVAGVASVVISPHPVSGAGALLRVALRVRA